MKQVGEAEGIAWGLVGIIVYLLTSFPGGTLVMAGACGSHKLSGIDWVLSVIIPAYGVIRGLTC